MYDTVVRERVQDRKTAERDEYGSKLLLLLYNKYENICSKSERMENLYGESGEGVCCCKYYIRCNEII